MRFVYLTPFIQKRTACTSVVVSIVESQPTAEIVVLWYYGFVMLKHLEIGAWWRILAAHNTYYTDVRADRVTQGSIMASSRSDAG